MSGDQKLNPSCQDFQSNPGGAAVDPWSSGGVTTPIAGAPPSVVVLFIEEAAHHLDLRASDPSDPEPVVTARSTEDATMLGWLQAHYDDLGQSVPALVKQAMLRVNLKRATVPGGRQ